MRLLAKKLIQLGDLIFDFNFDRYQALSQQRRAAYEIESNNNNTEYYMIGPETEAPDPHPIVMMPILHLIRRDVLGGAHAPSLVSFPFVSHNHIIYLVVIG